MFDRLSRDALVPLLLRLGLAAIFIYHGLDLVGKPEGHWGTNWRPELPVVVQVAVAWGELLGGIAMALGFLTRPAALGLAIIMAGAIATVHWQHGFANNSKSGAGYEFNMLIILVCAALALSGGGTLAVDRFFRLRRRTS
jgi:putative oxidoreductase